MKLLAKKALNLCWFEKAFGATEGWEVCFGRAVGALDLHLAGQDWQWHERHALNPDTHCICGFAPHIICQTFPTFEALVIMCGYMHVPVCWLSSSVVPSLDLCVDHQPRNSSCAFLAILL